MAPTRSAPRRKSFIVWVFREDFLEAEGASADGKETGAHSIADPGTYRNVEGLSIQT